MTVLTKSNRCFMKCKTNRNAQKINQFFTKLIKAKNKMRKQF